ncbi:winged helix-turn-helix transcriptional regulator [Candidatus Woesearchaeota archaeon]|nr:winged helix-turn-helix transcriptional regulator [Candidatus Woesearchaeota archaeon]
MRQALRQPYQQFFGTLANQARIDIIETLREGPKNVKEIGLTTGLEQSHISHNLKRLEECGFITVEQKGREKICTLNQESIKPLLQLMDNHMENYCCHVVARKEANKQHVKEVHACHTHSL